MNWKREKDFNLIKDVELVVTQRFKTPREFAGVRTTTKYNMAAHTNRERAY